MLPIQEILLYWLTRSQKVICITECAESKTITSTKLPHSRGIINIFYLFGFDFLKTGSYVVQDGLKLTWSLGWRWTPILCSHLPSPGLIGMHYPERNQYFLRWISKELSIYSIYLVLRENCSDGDYTVPIKSPWIKGHSQRWADRGLAERPGGPRSAGEG